MRRTVQVKKTGGAGAQRGGRSRQGPGHDKEGLPFQFQRETISVFQTEASTCIGNRIQFTLPHTGKRDYKTLCGVTRRPGLGFRALTMSPKQCCLPKVQHMSYLGTLVFLLQMRRFRDEQGTSLRRGRKSHCGTWMCQPQSQELYS